MKNMKILNIYETIKRHFHQAASHTDGEIGILKEALGTLDKHPWSDPSIKVRTNFVHQKPYAHFVNPADLWGKKKTELGDILFVIKYKHANQVKDHRAIFSQVKYDRDSALFDIEMHQLEFYMKIADIQFRFGNRVYGKSNIQPMIWQELSKPRNFGFDLLIGQKYFRDIETEIISFAYPGNTAHFRFNPNLISPFFRYYSTRIIESRRPLIDFLRIYGRGNDVKGQFLTFIELIYKYLGWTIDPPEEHKGFWDDDKKGFGVVEITIGE